MTKKLSRRRLITLSAVAATLPLWFRAGDGQARPVVWEGTAMGAPARLTLYHTDRTAAEAAIAAAVAELDRLESLFSLYRPDSALSRLNRAGSLDQAPADLIALAEVALQMAALSDGAFDPTIQPLWRVYFDHFTGPAPDPRGPSAGAVAAALALVDWRQVAVDPGQGRIALTRPGMALSLNGVAQGFIGDRVAAVLRAHGLDRMLVDMGEPIAVATHPDGSPWRIGVAHPALPDRAVTVLDVVDRAVATSGGYGTTLDPDGRFTHLFDPRTGATAPAAQGVTVIARSAASADALSTALAVTPVDRRRVVLERSAAAFGPVSALFVSDTGAVSRIDA